MSNICAKFLAVKLLHQISYHEFIIEMCSIYNARPVYQMHEKVDLQASKF